MAKQNNKRIGFTLSEVLVTLLVIGVVAAMTVPILNNAIRQADLNTEAKKALSVANQAYTMAVNDNGGGFGAYYASQTQSVVKFNALKSQLKITNDCPYNSNPQGKCWSASGVGLNNYRVPGCQMTSNDGSQFQNTSFTTADGMFWMLYSYSTTTGVDLLFVDVNGNKGPNDWGKDVFIFNLNDTNITPSKTGCTLEHNDGTAVNTSTEFMAPFK